MIALETHAPAVARRPRLGFLGVGWIGRHRMSAILAEGAGEAVAVADATAAALAGAREAAPECAIGRDLDDLLARDDLDGVVIATPSALHAEQAIRALERGIAVFCQKPLGRNATEVRRVVEAARAAGRLLGVDLSYRHVAGMDRVRALVQDGALGEVYAVNLVFHNAYGPDKAWFYDADQSGGGCVMDLGIHLVDLALWTLGWPIVHEVRSTLRAGGRRVRGRDSGVVEDFAAAQLELSNGAAVQLACSWRLPAGQDCLVEAAFYGTRGGAVLRNVNGSFYDFLVERTEGTRRETLAAPPDAWGGRAAVAWARALAAGGRFDPEVEKLADVAATLDRIYEG
ncbi:MAG TPA: Gfo/Idh/MocA family oxidoreductase [Anaeromyxobacteraceae bacterium]|nr:Gfo/Idh/MocA family oxidoreductase [Anaeromyxobacteraceae bacterium]